jgi:ferric-dicitrate binding protein FerR (iron transport regulator)
MNITKSVISDLFPLYAENECSAETRALVEDYLQRHPEDAKELKRVLSTPLPRTDSSDAKPGELAALRKARRVVRLQSWLLGLAIFLSLAPFSVMYTGGKTHWLLIEAPVRSLSYGAAAVVCWTAHVIVRWRFRVL